MHDTSDEAILFALIKQYGRKIAKSNAMRAGSSYWAELDGRVYLLMENLACYLGDIDHMIDNLYRGIAPSWIIPLIDISEEHRKIQKLKKEISDARQGSAGGNTSQGSGDTATQTSISFPPIRQLPAPKGNITVHGGEAKSRAVPQTQKKGKRKKWWKENAVAESR